MTQTLYRPTNTNDIEQSSQLCQSFQVGLSDEDATMSARLLKVLADKTRLQILSMIHRHGGDVCVTDIVTALTSLEQPTISHHIRIMRDAGLIDVVKKGLFAYYYIRVSALPRVQATLTLCNDLFKGMQEVTN